MGLRVICSLDGDCGSSCGQVWLHLIRVTLVPRWAGQQPVRACSSHGFGSCIEAHVKLCQSRVHWHPIGQRKSHGPTQAQEQGSILSW